MKTLITISFLLLTLLTYSQKISGTLKSGKYQVANPFSITYRSKVMATAHPESESLTFDLRRVVDKPHKAVFTSDNKGQIIVHMQNNRKLHIVNIRNIHFKEGQLIAYATDMSSRKLIKIILDKYALLLIEVESNIAFNFSSPKTQFQLIP